MLRELDEASKLVKTALIFANERRNLGSICYFYSNISVSAPGVSTFFKI